MKAIRSQRPNAVESIKQYASLYLCLLYYIKVSNSESSLKICIFSEEDHGSRRIAAKGGGFEERIGRNN